MNKTNPNTSTHKTKLTKQEVAIRGKAINDYGQENIYNAQIDGLRGVSTINLIALGHRDPEYSAAATLAEYSGISIEVLRPDKFDPVRILDEKYPLKRKRDGKIDEESHYNRYLTINELVNVFGEKDMSKLKPALVFDRDEVVEYAKVLIGG